jgi:hypothetical protein
MSTQQRKRFIQLTEMEIQDAYQYQKVNSNWTFYQERDFFENLFNTRFNYLLVYYSLCITGFCTIVSPKSKLVILWVSLPIILLLSIFLYRIYFKLMLLLKILYSLNDKNPLLILDVEVKKSGIWAMFSANFITGIIIPIIMIISLIVGIIAIMVFKWSP